MQLRVNSPPCSEIYCIDGAAAALTSVWSSATRATQRTSSKSQTALAATHRSLSVRLDQTDVPTDAPLPNGAAEASGSAAQLSLRLASLLRLD